MFPTFLVPIVTAYITVVDEYENSQLLHTSTGHVLQCGGRDGDGFCYGHQSFDCVLTPAEKAAEKAAERRLYGEPSGDIPF